MIVDLHVHTTRHSPDSSLTPEELVKEARRIGLDAVCITEHVGQWDRFDLERFSSMNEGVLLIAAMEVETEIGHVTVYGLDGYVSGLDDFRELRRAVTARGGYMVMAHPFRYLRPKSSQVTNLLFKEPDLYPDTPEEATAHWALQMVDAIEVANGSTNDEENAFAREVAQILGKPMTGGSDSHSHHSVGSCATVFSDQISSAKEFLEALHQGRFHPATGLNVGNLNLKPFSNGHRPS